MAAILGQHIEDIIHAWVADLRRTPETAVHHELLSTEIVDGMKAMLGQVTVTIDAGVAPDLDSARAAEAAQATSHRAEAEPATRGEERPPPADATLPEPATVLPFGPPETAEMLDGRLPAPGRRRLYRARDLVPPAAAQVDDAHGEAFRQALMLAEEGGRLRHVQGYQINEVVQEYIFLRRRVWKTLVANMRRTDQPAIELAIYLEGLMDNLLTSTVHSYQQAAVADLEKRAVRDPLTSLYNREYCLERIQEEIRRARRHDTQLALIMFDLDYLKQINDTYGHLAGDLVLVHVATGMRKVARESDVLCRYGGDEFAVILPGSDRTQGAMVAERLRAVLRGPVYLGALTSLRPERSAGAPGEVLVTISAGVAGYPVEARTAEALIGEADASLYRAKAAGRDRVA